MATIQLDPNQSAGAVGADAKVAQTFGKRLLGPVKIQAYGRRQIMPICPACNAAHTISRWSSGKMGLFNDLREHRAMHLRGVLEEKEVFNIHGVRIVWTGFQEDQLAALEDEAAKCWNCGARSPAVLEELDTEAKIGNALANDWRFRFGAWLMELGRKLHHWTDDNLQLRR
jgi:hypothetical protein